MKMHIIIDTVKFTMSCVQHHTVLESQLFFLVLFMNCLGYKLIIAQVKTNTKWKNKSSYEGGRKLHGIRQEIQ